MPEIVKRTEQAISQILDKAVNSGRIRIGVPLISVQNRQ